jgi:hypothetical protein
MVDISVWILKKDGSKHMNEEKVEDMKAQIAIRQTKIHFNPKARFSADATSNEAMPWMRMILSAIKKCAGRIRSALRKSDLSLETWHQLEYRNEAREERNRDKRPYFFHGSL